MAVIAPLVSKRELLGGLVAAFELQHTKDMRETQLVGAFADQWRCSSTPAATCAASARRAGAPRAVARVDAHGRHARRLRFDPEGGRRRAVDAVGSRPLHLYLATRATRC
jgi:hypothetical protein